VVKKSANKLTVSTKKMQGCPTNVTRRSHCNLLDLVSLPVEKFYDFDKSIHISVLNVRISLRFSDITSKFHYAAISVILTYPYNHHHNGEYTNCEEKNRCKSTVHTVSPTCLGR
jgi:hypothetical protein